MNTSAPALPTHSAVSISSSAMLVELNIGVWTARKKDRAQSSKVNSDNHAVADASSVHKNLLTGCDLLTAITKLTGNIRNLHYSMTMPWSDGGARLIPTAGFPAYVEQITGLEQEWNKLVKQFLNEYDDEIINAQVKLGDMFTRDEYPTVEQIADKFSFKLQPIPVPESGDFRVDVTSDVMSDLQESYSDYYQQKLKGAMDDIWQRVFKALTAMSERLDYVGKQDKKIFRDSLVDNVHELVDLLEIANITNDPEMTSMQQRLSEALRGVTPEALRESDVHRLATKTAIDKAIAALPSLGY